MYSIKKRIVAASMLGVALLGGLAPSVGAQSIADLQSQINALMAQLASLQGGSAVGTGFSFTQNLTIGSTGSEVVALQQMLVARGHLVMPTGVAYGYFGTLTQSALARWQAANGVVPASGYWGPISRAKAASLGGSVVTNPTVPGPSTGVLQGGAGDIMVSKQNIDIESEVLEGESRVKVLGFDIDAVDSDVRITSVRVELQHKGEGSRRLERYADEIHIMLGNTVVGSVDVDDFSRSNNVYSRNIPLTSIVREGDTGRFHVAVSAVRNVDSRDIGESWEVALGQVRFQDGTNAFLADNSGTGIGGTISEEFTFEDLASAGNIQVRISDGNDSVNNARTVNVDSSRKTSDVEILSFVIEARGSDVTLDEIRFEVTANGAGVTEIANRFRLMMGNREVGRARIDTANGAYSTTGTFTSSSDTTRTITIVNLDDVEIDRGDEESFALVADINNIGGNFSEGDSLSVTLSSSSVEAEDANGDEITTNSLRGSATSGPIDFASTGIMVSVTNTLSPIVLAGVANDSTDDQGRFVMEFEVTAFEDTSWIRLLAASSTDAAADNLGAAFFMEDASTGNVVGTGATTAILERISGGVVQNGYVRINDGQTAKFRLVVYYDPVVTGIYRVQMNSVGYASTQTQATDKKDLTPSSSFQSSAIQVLN